MQFKPLLSRSLRWLGLSVFLLVTLLVGTFGFLQTSIGLGWSGRLLAGLMSSPGYSVTVRGLEGSFPFDLRVTRIEISDERGTWLALNDAHLDIVASELLAGTLHIRALTIGEIAVARMPAASPRKPVPLSERLRLPQLPVSVTLDHLALERLALGADILGETVEATVAGRAVLQGGVAEFLLDLHRTDGMPGNLGVELRESGLEPVLALRVTASEPTGLLLGQWLNRADRPALTASFSGDGPLTDWHGRFEASAGQLAKLAGEVAMSAARDTSIAVNGNAVIAPLLPPELAALAGDSVPISARARVSENGVIALEALSIEMAAGQLNADLALTGPDRAIAGHLRANLAQLGPMSGLFGQPVRGSAELIATISGNDDRPRLRIDATGESIGIAGAGVSRADARVDITWRGNPSDPSARLEVGAGGRIEGIAMPQQVPPELGRDIDWSLAATGEPDRGAVEVTDFNIRGAGVNITGAGKAGRFGQELEASLRLAITDLRPLAGVLGRPLEGELTLNAAAHQPSRDRNLITLDASIERLHTGIAALDAIAGNSVAIAGSAQRDPDGVLRLDKLTLTGASSALAATGNFDPATRQLAATINTELHDLQMAGALLGTRLGGKLSGTVAVAGRPDGLRVQGHLNGEDLVAGAAALDRVRLEAEVADTARPNLEISGDFRSGRLEGTLAFEADAENPAELVVRRLRLNAGDSVLNADLRIEPKTLLTRGTVKAVLPDLAPWSRLTGTPLAGHLDATAELGVRSGQSLDLSVNADRLSFSTGGSRITVDHIAATTRLKDLFGTPSGGGRANITAVSFPAGGLTTATLSIDSPQPGRFAFDADARGTFTDPFSVSLAGTGELAPNGAAIDTRVSRVVGSLGADRIQLMRPLSVAKRGNDLMLSGLNLHIGSGQITGNAARRGNALSADVTGRNLSLASAARLAGYHDVSGTAGFDISIAGTVAVPDGRFAVSGQGLRFAVSKQQRLPTLGLDLGGTWNGRELSLNGKVTGIKGDRLELSGTAPLALTSALAVAVPPQGRLALRLEGSGDVGNLADLLPLGEDRFTGRFTIDGSITGTPAAPAASGQLTITDGRYENFATGAVLTRMRLDLAGDRDRLIVREFSATDAAKGSLAGRGSIVLGGAGPIADLSVSLDRFRAVGRDEAVLTSSGTVGIAGAISSPKVTVRLTTEQGELRIPDNLSPSVTRLQVVEINNRAKKVGATKSPKTSRPAIPAALDIQIAVPGPMFVRGRGLDSEWRGRINVTGTSDAPRIIGSLEAIRGTFDFLGKSFKLSRGNIALDGGATIDPTLDIVAEIAASDITAQVSVTGPVSAPKIAMSSVPSVPQDEILSRVLFNRAVGQITAAEGIQVAQAAATLAGGGPGVLDRLRGRIGLDRLVFGSAPSGMASSNLNPAAGGSASSSTAISGGKYVAEGVYVGATQGLTPQSSKVMVEIEVRPRVTVQSDFSQTGGSGIGLNYKYDY
jgi:translocation and assembly module TamB